MNELLHRQIKALTTGAGVYKFYSGERLLYVGKAKLLRSRVLSYFRQQADLSPAKQKMVKQIDRLETIKVANETEALFWEANLIKQYQPPYNVVFKDDKNWLYLAIDYQQDFPVLSLRRGIKTKSLKYFGPYSTTTDARRVFHLLKKIFALKTCSNPPSQPCWEARLGRCRGHNLNRTNKKIYQDSLKQAEKILLGQSQQIINQLTSAMKAAALAKKFEQAAKLRDQIKSLKQTTVKQNVISPRLESFDIFGLYRYSDLAAVCRLPIRRGILLDGQNFLLEHSKNLSEEEIWEDFLPQYYTRAPHPPRLIYLPGNLPTRITEKIKLKKVERGYKRNLIKLANDNAQNFLEQSGASWNYQTAKARQGLNALRTSFNLTKLPRRIEGYDISNIQGQKSVGVMAVLTNGVPDPKHYRKFKIQGPAQPNDVRMLAEVLTRRFTKNIDWPRPDLILLDGGAGQLSAGQKILDSYDINITLIALAKKKELIYLNNSPAPLRLPANNPGLLMLEQLRNEAHRFGVSFYRSRHRQYNLQSEWNQLPGIGENLRRRLKTKFNNIDELKKASLSDLRKILGNKKAVKLNQYLEAN